MKLDRCRFSVGWSTFVHSFLLRSDFVQLQCCQIHISGNWMSSFIVFDEKRAGFIYVWKSGWSRITFLIIREKDWIWFLKDFSIWCASTWWNRFFHNLDLIGHFVRVFWQESFVSVIPKIWWIILMLQVTFGFFIAQQGKVPMNWWIKDGFDHSGENLMKVLSSMT